MDCCCVAEVFQIVAATQQCFFHPCVLICVSVFLLQPIGFIFCSQFWSASVLLLFIDIYWMFLLAVCNGLLLVYHYRWLRFSSLVSLGLAYFLRGSFLCSLDLISFCFLCYSISIYCMWLLLWEILVASFNTQAQKFVLQP